MKSILKQLKWLILIELIFHILYSSTNVVLPMLNKILFDQIFVLGWGGLGLLLLAYLVSILANSGFQYISQVYEWKVTRQFFVVTKKLLAEKLLSRSKEAFQKKTTAEYLSIFDNDLETIDQGYLSPLVDLIKSSLSMVISALSLFFVVHPLVALGMILASLFAVVVPKIVAERLANRQRAFLKGQEAYFQTVTDLFSAKNRINPETFGQIVGVHHQRLDQSEEVRYQFGEFNTFVNVLNGFSMFVVQLTAYGLVGYLLLKGQVTVGAAVATFSYVENFIYPMKEILMDINSCNATKKTVAQLDAYLQDPIMARQAVSPVLFDQFEVRHLSYRLGEVGLSDWSYVFDKGRSYAIVGPSGVGKSTFFQVLTGDFPLTEGQVLLHVEGEYRQLVATDFFYLSQFEHLYRTSFDQNISVFGTYRAGRDRMQGLLDRLPESVQTVLFTNQDPSLLSGGERNLQGILRALMSGKNLLFLDEATSHLDPQLTDLVWDYLLHLEGVLIIAIIHDPSQRILERFDQVLTMRKGELEASQPRKFEKNEKSVDKG